ncbi:MAG: pitrilysin family protein [Thermodesulfobacteriota bacterium]
MEKTNQFLTSYRKTVLDNGLRIVTERVPHAQSISLGLWVGYGSRFETPELNGICHFIEHMLFKGTARRSAYDIAREMDSVGGIINAFTSKEMTSFYCKVLSENTELAVDLLTDLFLNASFPEDEIEREKQVICQEILQVEDTPEDLVYEMLGVRFWQDDPLGRPILGTIPTVSAFDRETVVRYKVDHYTPEETIVCAAGDLEHDALVEMIEKEMGRLKKGVGPLTGPKPVNIASTEVVRRELEQVHVCVGVEGPSALDPARHAAHLLNNILGGGMSSRLFQEIREKRGLAYSVYSFISTFSDTGMFGVYAGCDAARLEELLSVIRKESVELPDTLTEEEIRTAKQQIRGSAILANESTDSVMNRLAKSEYFFRRHIPLEEVLDAVNRVTRAELCEMAEQMVHPSRFTTVALGPVPNTTDPLAILSS